MRLKKTIKPVRIFSVDRRYGADNPYTLADLRNVVRNWNTLQRRESPGFNNPRVAYIPEPEIGIGHGEDQLVRKELLRTSVLDTLANATDLPSAGKPAKLWIEGLDLYAELVDVPEVLADACDNGQFCNISAEFYKNFRGPYGMGYGPTLKRISFIGASNPRLKGLGGIPRFKSQEPASGRPVQQTVTVFTEFKPMTREEAIQIISASCPGWDIPADVPDAWLILMATKLKEAAPALDTLQAGTGNDGQANGYPQMAPDVFAERVMQSLSQRVANQVLQTNAPVMAALAEMRSSFGEIAKSADLQAVESFAEANRSRLYPFEMDKGNPAYIVPRLLRMEKSVRESEMKAIQNRPLIHVFSERMPDGENHDNAEHRKIVGGGSGDRPSAERLASLRQHSKIGQALDRNRARAALGN